MRLGEALKRAARFAAKEGVISGVRVAPPTATQTGYVMATDGVAGIYIPADKRESVPDIVVDAGAIKSTMTSIKKEPFILRRSGHETVSVTTESGKEYHLLGHDPRQFPNLPAFPSSYTLLRAWDLVSMVIHAASGDEDRPELNCVHFGPHFTEATDRNRAARVPVRAANGQGYLVDKSIFKHWPRKSTHGVGIAFANGNAYVHVDQEVRFTRAKPDSTYYDISKLVPKRFDGRRWRVSVDTLKVSVRDAVKRSPRDWCQLTFRSAGLEVLGLAEDMEDHKFLHEIPVEPLDTHDTGPAVIVVRGRLLWDSLNALGRKEVILGITTHRKPLRLECPHYVEHLEPLYDPQESPNADHRTLLPR